MMRLDALLVEKNIAPGRDRAKALIMAGLIYVDGEKAERSAMNVSVDSELELRGHKLPYVSRGGLKLAKAATSFGLALEGLVCMDIGASTGGFTDCMLQNGARKVYAVDVGYGQLAWQLRSDERVVVMERTNIRYVTPEQIGEALDFVSVDVSFISLTLVLPVASRLMRDGARAVCLIKPQFEAGRNRVGKKGVVRDPEVHIEVMQKIVDFVPGCGLQPLALDFSPVKGPEGNIEYLLLLEKADSGAAISTADILAVVQKSHEELPPKGVAGA